MTRPLADPAAPWPRWLDGLSRGVLVVLGLVCVASIASYLLAPEAYTFGTEVGGWTYRSRAHYLGPLLAELCVLAGASALSARNHGVWRVLLLRGVVVLLDLAFLLMRLPEA